MHPITPFGGIHTAISLIAVAAGIIAFIRDKAINPANAVGKTYILFTILTCVTGFFIFHDTGHFGAPHMLGIITLAVLGLAGIAGAGKFGTASRSIETICYSTTFFFHMIPAITEGATRLPAGHPLAASQDAPGIKLSIAIALFLLLGGLKMQLKKLRKERESAAKASRR
jgi:uncharacterized membrane protein